MANLLINLFFPRFISASTNILNKSGILIYLILTPYLQAAFPKQLDRNVFPEPVNPTINIFLLVMHIIKFLEMELDSLRIICFHNTDNEDDNIISTKIKTCFNEEKQDIILGDFNDLQCNSTNKYRDLVTLDMITYKPAQTTLDHIFIKVCDLFEDKVCFNGIIETYSSDHNLLTFSLNI